MADPVIVPRAEHAISRRDIDPDALKVLYRLRDFNYTAYLVGGGVRDLLLGRAPKDFDVGTDAHPYQIKKLFRNCWIIGRRFRLAHVRFGAKTIEVATFRRHVPAAEAADTAADEAGFDREPVVPPADLRDAHPAGRDRDHGEDASHRQHHHPDNTFGTPEEDAFRRDFTINALFYDIANFSLIDYVGGLEDLRRRVIRSIGDPLQRFEEDPVRMLRAIVFAARLDFTLDAPIVEAIRARRDLMATAAPARLIEEYYKILRSGSAERTFRMLAEHGLLEPVTPELQRRATHEPLWDSLRALDSYRRRYVDMPPQLTNPVLLGSLLLPIGMMPRFHHADEAADQTAMEAAHDEVVEGQGKDGEARRRPRGRVWSTDRRDRRPKPPVLKIGVLPIARRDSERLRQLLAVQHRLRDLESSPRAKRALLHRGPFEDALTWLDVHGQAPEIVEHWRGFIEALGGVVTHAEESAEAGGAPEQGVRRRRRRRGGRRRGFRRPREG
ncbi:MAG TPA: polynucleotide adenylyltransferase PcnB [Vicinamibacterales bacterium]|nr:polynucleotide adenylyltransferase PcnB [Vicinamibacterales bacterium]